MRILLRLFSVFSVAIKRLLSQKGLMLASILGLAAVSALIMSVPLYANAVYHQTFFENITREGTNSRPPFAFLFNYLGSWYDTKQWEEVQPVDIYLTEEASSIIGLPEEQAVRHYKTEPFGLFPDTGNDIPENAIPLSWNSIGFISNLEENVLLIAGDFPSAASPEEGYPVEILIGEALAEELDLQAGDRFIAVIRDRNQTGGETTTQVPVQIAGIWRPKNPDEAYWFTNPDILEKLLLVPEESFITRITPQLEDEVYTATWYLVLDGSDINASDAGRYLSRINYLRRRADVLLPNIDLDESPVENLYEYRRAEMLLTVLLITFSFPIIGLMLVFIGLVTNISVERQRNEIAVLRSRGGTVLQIIGIVAVEGLLLGAVSLAASFPISTQIARTIGQTRSFLEYSGSSDLRVVLTRTTINVGMIAIGLAVAALVVPTISAARHTIVSYKQERARMLRPPWWQRMWLDVFLLIPTVYGAYLLRQQGGIAVFGVGISRNPFENPLLFLVPALGVLSLTLLFLRLLPILMSRVAWVVAHTRSVSLLMAVRHLARTPGSYSTPLALLVLTLSLAAFTATLARALDTNLRERMYYQLGADISFTELGEFMPRNPYEAEDIEELGTGSQWVFFPVEAYPEIQGVETVSRVGRYPAFPRLSTGSTQGGTFLGVDRYYFPQIAFWRRDFAPTSLGAMMNELALAPDGVLVDRNFLRVNALRVGDTIGLTVDTVGQNTELELKIVGVVNLFPTWYPEQGPLFVGNLGYLFEHAGGEYPYQVWLKTDPTMDQQLLVEENLQVKNPRVLDWESALQVIDEEQKKPQRQGLFGVLSIGFAAAALLTVLGFLLYAYFSYRRRFIELGVLRAIGLSTRQMTIYLAWELGFLIITGGAIGTGLGVLISLLFIPYYQIGVTAVDRFPPFQVWINWSSIFQVYALFGLLFVITLGVLTILLRRMKIFQAIKLGETV